MSRKLYPNALQDILDNELRLERESFRAKVCKRCVRFLDIDCRPFFTLSNELWLAVAKVS